MKDYETFRADWMMYIVLRNLVVGNVLYCGWHYFLYHLMAGRMESQKFNKRWPTAWQHKRDWFWTNSGLLISSAFEIGVFHAWGSKKLPYYADFWAYPMYSVFHLLLIGYWRFVSIHLRPNLFSRGVLTLFLQGLSFLLDSSPNPPMVQAIRWN